MPSGKPRSLASSQKIFKRSSHSSAKSKSLSSGRAFLIIQATSRVGSNKYPGWTIWKTSDIISSWVYVVWFRTWCEEVLKGCSGKTVLHTNRVSSPLEPAVPSCVIPLPYPIPACLQDGSLHSTLIQLEAPNKSQHVGMRSW